MADLANFRTTFVVTEVRSLPLDSLRSSSELPRRTEVAEVRSMNFRDPSPGRGSSLAGRPVGLAGDAAADLEKRTTSMARPMRNHSGDVYSTKTDAWALRKGESVKAYEAFLAYVNMGRDRSLRKMATEGGQKGNGNGFVFKSLGVWSAKHAWQDRVAAIDRAEAEKRRKEVDERHRLECIKLQRTGIEAIDAHKGPIPLSIAVKMVLEGMKGEKLASGPPTERTQTELSGPGGGPIPVQQETTASDALAHLEAKLDAIAAARQQVEGPGD